MHYRKTMPAPSSDIPFEFIHPWLFQALPTLDTGLVTHYLYTMFLTMLLTDHAFCDDDHCCNKYGLHWDKYCHSIPCKKVQEYLCITHSPALNGGFEGWLLEVQLPNFLKTQLFKCYH